jgi:hypothetical protein
MSGRASPTKILARPAREMNVVGPGRSTGLDSLFRGLLSKHCNNCFMKEFFNF